MPVRDPGARGREVLEVLGEGAEIRAGRDARAGAVLVLDVGGVERVQVEERQQLKAGVEICGDWPVDRPRSGQSEGTP